MIRFNFFSQDGRGRFDMVGAGGGIHTSRASDSVANADRAGMVRTLHSAAAAYAFCGVVGGNE